MVSSHLSVVVLTVLVFPEITGARMLKKHELKVPDFLAEGTTEYPGTEEPIEPERPECGENEVYLLCSDECEPRCETPVFVGCMFSPACTARCQCREGYARNSEGKCVADAECLAVPCKDPNAIRKRIGLNEVCRETCKYGNQTKMCPDEMRDFHFMCECKPGYMLEDYQGKCVPINECKFDPCQENEEFVKCDDRCEPKCGYTIGEGCRFQPACTPRCKCKEGYSRSSEDKCISDCSSDPVNGGQTQQ
ncbi:trypsin Inhibitor like cysteine rich domain protein [Ancylostoma caninum]|uniref:Trypsin Inhibitor like cysteine rich domain protein n=1 Tax=Ancylostoma caninum TaxID=29170 RepID=A0A368H455_ANCCA|nr:trypsin Inhibitor like cysteine rich domain protein [Ancylostoma caninum]